MVSSAVFIALAVALRVNAHIAAWSKGMYCKNGLSTTDQPNTNTPTFEPLSGLNYSDWFMHGACRNYPPPSGEFLQLPAGGSFTVEMAEDRAFTTLSYNGSKTTDWGDGQTHPANYGNNAVDPRYPLNSLGCITSPNLHAKNQSDVAGSAFAISYNSNMANVNMDNLVVFTVAAHTPYKRIATFNVPKYLPACPPGGCICAWGWVPNFCGLANEYMLGYRCMVTNVSATPKKLAVPKSPTWCENAPNNCTKGAKKMSIGHQLQGNTVTVVRDVPQADGQWRSWGYNMKLGFADGAQEDIYA